MKPEFTPTGIDIQTQDEIFLELENAYKAIYGNDIVTDQDSPDGQRIGIEAKARLDVQSFAAALYSSLDPELAEGVSLDRLLKLIAITRRPATQSTWDLTVTVSKDVTLTTGYTIEDDSSQRWVISSDVALTAGANVVTFRSERFAAITGTAGATFTQISVVTEVQTITAPGNASVGVDGETDQELRIRRNKSVQNPSYSTTGGLFAKLANTAGVTDLALYENDTDSYDATLDLNAHSIWVVIEGGSVEDIVETITKNKTGGTGTKGSVTGTFTETLNRPDETTFELVHEQSFDRPTDVPLYINLNASRKVPTEPIDTDLIKQKIASFSFNIGTDLSASMLYELAYDAGDNFILYDLEISDDDAVFTDENLTPGADGKFSIDTANIDITEI